MNNNELLKKLKKLQLNEETEVNGIRYKAVPNGWCWSDSVTGAIGFIPDVIPDDRKTVEERTIRK